MKNNYIFKNFINNKEYKKKLTELVRRMSNLEIGGYRMYDGTGTHYMQNPKEIVDLIFFLKKHEKQYSFKLKNFLEIGFAAGVNNTFLNKLFNFKKIVAVDYARRHLPPERCHNCAYASPARIGGHHAWWYRSPTAGPGLTSRH